jgi:hypothetical protein
MLDNCLPIAISASSLFSYSSFFTSYTLIAKFFYTLSDEYPANTQQLGYLTFAAPTHNFLLLLPDTA